MVVSGGDSSTTACVVVISPTPIVCANVGESRAVFAPQNPAADFAAQATAILLLLRTVRIGYKVFPLSFDHTPAASRGVRVRSCVVVIPQPLLYVPMWEIHVPSLRRGIPRPLSPAQAAAILLPLQNHYEQYKYYLEVGRRFFPYRLITHPRPTGGYVFGGRVDGIKPISRGLGSFSVLSNVAVVLYTLPDCIPPSRVNDDDVPRES